MIPHCLFQEPIEINARRILDPEPLEKLVGGIIEIHDKQLNEELVKKMINQ